LFPHLTVEENVGFGLRDRSRGERARRSAEVIERLGLVGLARRYPRELSGGQRQRVALGRALAIDPALLLLDEPLSALDAPLRRTLRDELRETLTGWGTPAVVVTHDFTEAYRLADRIVVYESGRVIQSAPRAELLWQPASEAVARIMGLRNVLRGTVVKATPERIQLSWRGQTLEAVNSPTRSYLPTATGSSRSTGARSTCCPPDGGLGPGARERARQLRRGRRARRPVAGGRRGRGARGDRAERQRQVYAPARGGAPRATDDGPCELRRPRGGRDPRARRAAPDGHGVPAAVARRHDGGRERRARPGLPRRRRRPGRGAGRPLARAAQHRAARRPARANALGRREIGRAHV